MRMGTMGRLITTEEFAEKAHSNPATIRYWVHTKYAPPSAKLGRRRVWREEDVDAWLEAKFDAS